MCGHEWSGYRVRTKKKPLNFNSYYHPFFPDTLLSLSKTVNSTTPATNKQRTLVESNNGLMVAIIMSSLLTWRWTSSSQTTTQTYIPIMRMRISKSNPVAVSKESNAKAETLVALQSRRHLLLLSSSSIALTCASLVFHFPHASASEFADMPALRGKDYGKTKMTYPDYTQTPSGLQFKDLVPGTGPSPHIGDTVVVDWDGYTIGYYGRIFEARNKTKGGSFEGNDKDFFKFKVGSSQVIPAFEEAVSTMCLGGIRRIIVPPELGYPDNDLNKKGPKPTTFSGQRALDFVLKNQGLIDKTLLFDIELLKIIPKS